MIRETEVTLTQTELTQILILATEFVRRDIKGYNNPDFYRTERTRQIWLRNCDSIILKMDKALDHCLVADEPLISSAV